MQPANSPSPDPAALLRAALPGDEPSAPWQPPTIADLAPKFPELVIEELAGRGGMAAVYRAVQTRLGRTVALKVMRHDLAAAPEFAERFVREARALAALSNPHVLTIHDFGERDGTCYLVTEYVDGANLRELMQLGRLSPAEVLRIVPQVCAGLAFAHQHGVVHRDIKPENVLVDRAGQVKLADFGLAKLVGARTSTAFTRSGQVFGTPHYMAPEQWQGSAHVDHRADIYSLGVVLYELLTGKLPVGTYPPASAQPGVPPGIDPIVQRSLQQEPEQRYQSAREVQRDLEAQRASAARSTPASTPASAATPTSAAATGLLAFATGILVCGLTALVMFVAAQSRLAMTRNLHVHQTEEARVTMQALRETVAQGKPWLGHVPEAPTASGEFELVAGLDKVIALAGLGTLSVLVMVLAHAAWRRTRQGHGSRLQHVYALVLFSLPPAAAVSTGVAWLADASRQDSVVVMAILLLGGAGTGLLALAWRDSGRRVPGPVDAVGWAAWTTVAVGLLLGATLVVTACLAPRKIAGAMPWNRPLAAQDLVGKTRLQVLERLGPPRSVTASTSSMIWGYRAIDGEDRNDALLFAGGVVTMTNHPKALLVPEQVPANGAFAGQTVAELVQALGPASDTAIGATTTTLAWPNGANATVSADGIVLHVGN